MTSTSSNLSTVTPGRPSASPKMRRQALKSAPMAVRLYSSAYFTLLSKKASLKVSFALSVSTRTAILLAAEYIPAPSQEPFSVNTSVMPPAVSSP